MKRKLKRRLGFLVGPSGVGKGYGVGDLLVEYHGVTRFVTGDWCRENATKFSDSGNRAPDDIILEAVKNDFTSRDVCDYLIDAPRSIAQVDRFINMFNDYDPAAIIYAVYIDAERKVCEDRLAERAVRQGRFDDSKPNIISNRLDSWYLPDGIRDTVVPHVRDRTHYIKIDGNLGIEQIRSHVFQTVCPRIFSQAHHGHRVPC